MKEEKSKLPTLHPLVGEVLFTYQQIEQGVVELAKKINKKYQNKKKSVILLGILKGCLPFMMELIKHLHFDVKIDFMVVSSYFGGVKKSSQRPKLVLDVDVDLENHHVIIVEDVVETGDTLKEVKNYLLNKKPASIKVASLIFKKDEKIINLDITPDWYVFTAPLKFLVGFGLDFQEKLRNLNYVGVLKTIK